MADNEKAMDKYGHAWRVGDMSLCLTALVSLMSGMGGWVGFGDIRSQTAGGQGLFAVDLVFGAVCVRIFLGLP